MKITGKIETQRIEFGNQDVFSNPKAAHIGYGTDENFVMPMGVSMISVLENNLQEPIAFHVLTEGISAKSIEKLRWIADKYPNCGVQIHFTDLSILAGLPIVALGKATYIRAFLEQILDVSVDRILYLDGDIVCIHSIEALLHRDFQGKTVMVVEDVPVTARKQEKKFQLQHYFNAGMIFMDMQQWRKGKISEHFLDVCFQYKEKLNYLDQDALNIVLKEQKLLVENIYNFIPAAPDITEIPNDTVFLHYAGTKPWYCWLDFPLKKFFIKYYKMSPWKEESLQQPRNYREMHYMSRARWRQGKYCDSVFMGTELLDGQGMVMLIGWRKIDPQGDPDHVVLERGSGVGQFHVFSMVGYIDHGLQRKLFRLLEYSLQDRIRIVQGAMVPERFFSFICPGPMLLFHIGLGNPVIITEMAAHQMQDDEILLFCGNLGKGLENVLIRTLDPYLMVGLPGDDSDSGIGNTALFLGGNPVGFITGLFCQGHNIHRIF